MLLATQYYRPPFPEKRWWEEDLDGMAEATPKVMTPMSEPPMPVRVTIDSVMPRPRDALAMVTAMATNAIVASRIAWETVPGTPSGACLSAVKPWSTAL